MVSVSTYMLHRSGSMREIFTFKIKGTCQNELRSLSIIPFSKSNKMILHFSRKMTSLHFAKATS